MDDMLRTPIIWFAVVVLFPVVHPWGMRFLFRQVQMKWFAISSVAVIGAFYFLSTAHPGLLLRYSGPKDAGGIATIHLAYEWAAVAGLVGWVEKIKKANTLVMVAVSVIGIVVLLLGFWVA
jgi:hypothetical protein